MACIDDLRAAGLFHRDLPLGYCRERNVNRPMIRIQPFFALWGMNLYKADVMKGGFRPQKLDQKKTKATINLSLIEVRIFNIFIVLFKRKYSLRKRSNREFATIVLKCFPLQIKLGTTLSNMLKQILTKRLSYELYTVNSKDLFQPQRADSALWP